MYIIVGLGNPGIKYEMTRHNMGFLVLDNFASRHGISISTKKHKALIGTGVVAGQKVVLVKPETFMNLSGDSVASVLNFYKEEIDNLIIVYDDVDLITGNIRLRERGSAGGHNGIKDIIAKIGTSEFKRIRAGVGLKPPFFDLADFVLSNFAKDELEQLREGVIRSSEAIDEILANGMQKAMNKCNKRDNNKEKK